MFEVGREHDGWFVDAQLGVGGMGAVYRAHKVSLPELVVAIKVVIQTDADAKARFRREAVALHKLSHPNVVGFRDVQCQEEPWYIVMDLVEGRSLKALMDEASLAEGTLPLSRWLALATQLASAVSYVHSRGLHHRDIKPTNILVDHEDKLVLVDFGIAVRKEDPRITTYGRCGSPSYAPPEWRAPDVDEEAWDVYSLGQVLYELCTGQEAFPADSIDEVMYLKRTVPALDPGEPAPMALRELIAAATALDPKRRPRASAVLQALEELKSDPARRPPPPEPALASLPTVVPPPEGTVQVPDPAPGPTISVVLPSQAPTQATSSLPAVKPGPSNPPPKEPARTPLGRLGVVILATLMAVAACFGLG